MATAVLSPSTQHQPQQQQQQVHLSSPPADNNPSYSKSGSSHITSLPAYTDKTPRRASINRYSWSSASSNNSAPSPTSPDNNNNVASTPTRKFRLPVRVSTDLTSFASSDSSPQSRRRSLSLASNDSKRRSSLIPALKKVEEASKASDEKSAQKSPEKPSPSKEDPSPPPPYKPVSDSRTTVTPSPAPSYQDIKPKEPTPPPKPAEQPAPEVQKPVVAPSPAKPENPPASRQVPTTNPITKMSSAASSPDAQKAAMANPMNNRGLDFSVGNGNTKLTHQSDHGGSLPLPNLSGRGNGPVGNLLRGPVDEEGNLKAAALTVGIKLDLEAEVHLSARVRGDILVGLY